MNKRIAALEKSGHLRRVDVRLADWIAREFPAGADATGLAAALAARAIAAGHSALALNRAQAWLDGLADDDAPALPATEAWRDALQNASAVHVHAAHAATTNEALIKIPSRHSRESGNPATSPQHADLKAQRIPDSASRTRDDGQNRQPPDRPLVLDAQGRVYLRRYFEYERQLAQALVVRAAAIDVHSASAPVDDARAGPPLDPEQQRAIDVAMSRRFTLVTGGPGTGKTHVVVRMLAALAQRAQARGTTLQIALSAPTGKAAARLGEALRGQLDALAFTPDVDAQIPRDAQTVHRLLGISPWRLQPRFDAATPLPFDVVVVDEVSMVDLPLMVKLVAAVAEGAQLILLGDPDQLSAVEAGNVLGALVEAAHDGPLHANHVALTHSHRFGVESALGALAAAITHGDAEAAQHALAGDGDVTLAADARIGDLIERAADAYQPVLAAADAGAALRAARGFRVLTALRHGPSGCLAIDRAIAARLQRGAGVRGDASAWRGRLILVTANRPELGLFNGDTGVLWPDAHGTLQAWFEGSGDQPRALPIAALPPHEGAFALTVHKSQGSEFDRIALVTGPDSAVLTRELLYTGVTRARSGVTVYATPEILRTGIARRTLRMTGLADRLREAQETSSERV